MVSTRRFGRLGNELYQYACLIGYARKYGLEYSIPRKTNDDIWNPVHFPQLYNEKWVEGREDVLLNENWNTEQQFQDIPFKEEWRNSQIVLNGYWQSFKYWDFCRDEVLKVFNLPYQFNKGVTAIHIRRGDYLLYPTKHPIVTLDYLKLAMINIIDRTGKGGVFKIFSDDIAWCKVNIPGDGENVLYSEGKNEIEDLVEMSCCENIICSNSTMALWGAELNQNPNKIVVTPHEDNWFGVDNKHLTVKDLLRSEWIKIKY